MSHLKPLEFKECVIDSPSFRENLIQHEKEIDYSLKVFKEIYTNIKKIYKTFEDCSIAFQELANSLKTFISNGNKNESELNNTPETEDGKKIRSAMEIYSDLITNIEVMRREHIFGASKDIIMSDLQKLKDECLSPLKRDIKEFKKKTAYYYMKLDKYSAIKYKQDSEYDNIDTEFKEDRRQYVTNALSHVMNIQNTEEQKTYKLLHILNFFMQMLNTFHHQAWDYFEDQKRSIDDVKYSLFMTEENCKIIASYSERLKQQLLTIPIEHIQPDSKVDEATRREGYLFVLTKKAVISDLWIRKFCVYEKESKKLIIIQSNQGIQSNTLKMQNEEYKLLSCERKMTNTIDRRFTFSVMIKNLSTPIIMQALTKEDLIQWLSIMDGKEPIYAKPRNVISIQELETILNDKCLKILLMCFSEIEKRGIDNEGIYRAPGRISQRDELIKKLIIDVENPTNSIMTGQDIELVDVDTLCSVVKAYIKYLKIPMATYVLYDEFIEAGKLQESNDKFSAVLKIIRKLPSDHFQIFFILITHLNKVAQHHEKNFMTAANLGMCFGPTIFRPKQGNSSLTTIRESKFSADVISLLIRRCSDFFTQFNSYHKKCLTPSKSMVLLTDLNNDTDISSKLNFDFPKDNFIRKPNLKRYDTDIHSTVLKPVILKPPIILPKPKNSKFTTFLKSDNSLPKPKDDSCPKG